MLSWKRPASLGVRDGRLARCRRSPNCVCSHADPADREHYVAPIAYRGTMASVRRAIEALPLVRVIEAREDYLYAEFRTPLLRFVDDVELYYEKNASVIQVRSASRLGRRDFGTNRRRVERLRALIQGLR